MPKVLFVGGPGNISSSAMEVLLEQHWEVGILTLVDAATGGLERRARVFRGDRDLGDALRDAFTAFRPDVAVDVCCFTPAQARRTVEAMALAVDQYVFVSTCDVYGYPLSRLPMRVEDAKRPPVSQYARDKLVCEQIFAEAAARAGRSLTIVRPSYSFGVNFLLNLFSRKGGAEMVQRIRQRRPLVVPGDGTTLMHAGSAWNAGRMLAAVVGARSAFGKSYTLAHEHAITHADYYRLFGRVVGVEPEIVAVPSELLLPLELRLIPDNLLSELTRFNVCFSVDEFRADNPGFVWERTLQDAAAEYVQFHDRAKDWPAEVSNYEDRIVAAWRKCATSFWPFARDR